MELSPQLAGAHTTASPIGQYVASIVPTNRLRISATYAPANIYTDVPLQRITSKEVTQLKWNHAGSHVAVVTAKCVVVVNLDDADHRVRIENGTAGFGRFSEVEFIGPDALLVIWEFGKVKIWDLRGGKGTDLGEVKCGCEGSRWGLRPTGRGGRSGQRVLALLLRVGADDVLNLYFVDGEGPRQFKSAKLPSIDAQSIEWSPDGRWISVLDVPIASQGVHFFTPDGLLFRSYPPSSELPSAKDGLGFKEMVWASNGRLMALARYDGRIVLLNTKTFAPLAIIEHASTIDQRDSTEQQRQAPIWQEAFAASGGRSYAAVSQPFSPPLSRVKPSMEPSELGVAEARFSCDGSWLATRDERMLNTVWIWDMSTLGAHAVLVQHNNVRRVHWHPTRATELVLDCGEGITYLYKPHEGNPPTPIVITLPGNPVISWSKTAADTKPAILATTRSAFQLLYPEGRPEDAELMPGTVQGAVEGTFQEGASEDSLFDVLSGRKPLPPRADQSYTERIDLEVDTEESANSVRPDDTFREKARRPVEVEIDPLDDSDIF